MCTPSTRQYDIYISGVEGNDFSDPDIIKEIINDALWGTISNTYHYFLV